MINCTTIELSIISALLSLFLNFCMREGHILAWWLDMWADLFLMLEHKEDLDYPEEDRRDYKFKQVETPWFKPLGYCVVCMNVWVSFLLSIWTLDFITVGLVIILSSFLVRISYERLL